MKRAAGDHHFSNFQKNIYVNRSIKNVSNTLMFIIVTYF